MEQSVVMVSCSSGFQSWNPNVFPTMRAPGFRPRNFACSFIMLSGRRNKASTVACEKSASNMSPWTNDALSLTPSFAAVRLDNSTISGLNSKPTARAPRLAAAMMLRPSPEPRSTT